MSDWFEKRTLGALLDEADRRYGPREALYYEGNRWSFSELRRDVDRCARGMIAAGIEPGEKISLWMPNRPEWIHALFAAAKIGAVVVPINSRFRTSDLEYVVRQSDTGTLITVDRSGPVDYLSMVHEVCPEIKSGNPNDLRPEKFPELRRVLVLGDSSYTGTQAWSEVMSTADTISQEELDERHRQVDPDGTVVMMYTSGTTGFTSRDVILMYLPLFHCFGLYEGPLASFVSGARVVLTTMFDPAESLRLIEQEGVTVMHGFDTHFHDLMEHPDCQGTDTSSLRTGILCAGMASSEPVARRAQKLLFPSITAWGMTEAGVGASRSFQDSPKEDRCTTSGYPLPGYEMKVIDPDTGEQMPYDEMGELCVRGYAVMQGYYKKPEETAQAVDSQGWMHTGDCVVMRDDGTIRFFGRYKDQLKVGGENVDPAEVEQFLLAHPAVGKVQVIGVPDQRSSEVVCACVVPRDGGEVTNADLGGLLPGQAGQLQGAPLHPAAGGLSHDLQREGPEVPLEGDCPGEAGPLRHPIHQLIGLRVFSDRRAIQHHRHL